MFWVPGKNKFVVNGADGVRQTIDYEQLGFEKGFRKAVHVFNELPIETDVKFDRTNEIGRPVNLESED